VDRCREASYQRQSRPGAYQHVICPAPGRDGETASGDAFFDKVKVNDDDAKVRENRLKLLNEIRAATRAVADFSKIEG